MKNLFEVSHIRSTSYTRDLNESNHISTLINLLKEPERYSATGTVSKIVRRITGPAIVLFNVAGKTWWVNEAEFSAIKFALESATTYIRIYYETGSISPFSNSSDNTIMINSSGVDGYKLVLDFN